VSVSFRLKEYKDRRFISLPRVNIYCVDNLYQHFRLQYFSTYCAYRVFIVDDQSMGPYFKCL
jgi:hypothetical protein